MGRGTREGLEGHGSSRPTGRASRTLRERKGCHQGLKKLTPLQIYGPERSLHKVPSSLLLRPTTASTTDLRPAPLVSRPTPSFTSESRRQSKENKSLACLSSSQAPRKYSLARQIFMRAARIHELGQILSHGCRHLSPSSAEAARPLAAERNRV